MPSVTLSDRAARAVVAGRMPCVPLPAGFAEGATELGVCLADGSAVGSVTVHGYLPVLDGASAGPGLVALGAQYPTGFVLYRDDVRTLQLLDYFEFDGCRGCDVIDLEDAVVLFDWAASTRAARLRPATVRPPFDVPPLLARAGTARCVPPTETATDGTERGWNVFATAPGGDDVPLGIGRARNGALALCDIVNALRPGELFTDLPLSSSDLLIVDA